MLNVPIRDLKLKDQNNIIQFLNAEIGRMNLCVRKTLTNVLNTLSVLLKRYAAFCCILTSLTCSPSPALLEHCPPLSACFPPPATLAHKHPVKPAAGM